MTIIVYELDGIDDVRFSPYCWRTLLALRHKGFHDFERVPVPLHDRSPIAFSSQKRVPVLADGIRWVSDSWNIACYLEDTYPDRPTLFGGDMGRANALFINAWVQQIHKPGLLDITLQDTFQSVDPVDREWWRAAREKRFGPTEAHKVENGRSSPPGATAWSPCGRPSAARPGSRAMRRPTPITSSSAPSSSPGASAGTT